MTASRLGTMAPVALRGGPRALTSPAARRILVLGFGGEALKAPLGFTPPGAPKPGEHLDSDAPEGGRGE
jgi:hypothetical protein